MRERGISKWGRGTTLGFSPESEQVATGAVKATICRRVDFISVTRAEQALDHIISKTSARGPAP
jgi:hypothetical protein